MISRCIFNTFVFYLKTMKHTLSLFITIGLINVLVSCGTSETKTSEANPIINAEAQEDSALLAEAQAFFKPLPNEATSTENQLSTQKILLGKTLFFDNRLSKNNTQSCNTCHNLSTYGVDNKPTSEGDLKKLGDRNSPTVYNAALHLTQFWDGRAKDVEEQAGMPILNPVEMNMPSENYVIDRLKKIAGYKRLFTEAFPEEENPITYDNLKKAIGAFERTLITPAPFHEYLNGNKDALTSEQKKGLREFINTGCMTCHNGVAMGGASLMKFPTYGDNYTSLTGSTHEDLGKMANTKNESDKFIFKVPSLINITETAPYFHDGSVADLGQAIKIMAKLQLNKELSDEQTESIKAFLSSLKGKTPTGVEISPEMPN